MSSNDVVKEIAKAVGMKLGKEYKSDRQAFYKKLVAAADELDDEEWESLSEKAQKWINTAIEAVNEGDTIPDPEDLDEDEEEEEESVKTDDGGDGGEEDSEEEEDEDSGESEADESEEEDASADKKTTRKKSATKKKTAAKKRAGTKKKSAKKKKTDGGASKKKSSGAKRVSRSAIDPVMAYLARQKDPLSVPFERVMDAMTKKGQERSESTVRSRYRRFLAAFRALQEAGRIK